MFVAALLTIAKIHKNLNVHPYMNGKENGVYIHTGRLLILKKEQNFTIYNTINGPWGHYAK